MHLNKQLFAAIAFALVLMVALIPGIPLQVSASDSDEIQDQIDQEQSRLADTEQELAQKQKRLDKLDKQLGNVKDRLPQLELELQKIKVQIAYNKLQLAYLDDAANVAELRYEQQLELQKLLLKASYFDWKLTKDIQRFLPESSETHYLKQAYYRNKLMTNQNLTIQEVFGELEKLKADYSDFESELVELQANNSALAAKRRELQRELALLTGDKSKLSGQVAGLYDRQQSIAAVIAELTAEQQAAAQREADIIDQRPTPPPAPPSSSSRTSSSRSSSSQTSTSTSSAPSSSSSSAATSTTTSSSSSSSASSTQPSSSSSSSATTSTPSGPSLKFRSHGRDYYQGHGVGMSQYGAHGMAQSGFSAEEILTSYYTDVDIVDVDLNVKLTIKYCANNPALDAYQDGCADGSAPVTQRVRFDNYLAGLGEMPESWPVEARKAQIIAARTYAMLHTNNGDPERPICITSYCQVTYIKDGDRGEMDVVQATANKVIMYNGQLIDALYSADNSQGRGTANNDTIFQDFYGNGTPYPYLRAFNDSQWATTTFWTNWSCTTNSYAYSDIGMMLRYMGNRGQIAQATKTKALALYNQVGTVTGVSFQRDPSQRVTKVTITGNRGSGVIGGWWFKYLWNEWVYATNRTNTSCFGEVRYDYIYSQSIFKQAG